MIVLKNIQLSYNKPIIKRANLTVAQGEILGLVGKSGAGKSSLLKIIAGLIDPDTGEISIDQQVQPRVHQLLIPGFKRVAMVNQDFKLDVYHTVEENLREVVLHLPNHKRDKRVQQLLRLFDLKSISATKAHLISGENNSVWQLPERLLINRKFYYSMNHSVTWMQIYVHG